MKKEVYFRKIQGKTLKEVQDLLDALDYRSLYQLWHDITGNTIAIHKEKKTTKTELRIQLMDFYKMDIYNRTVRGIKD